MTLEFWIICFVLFVIIDIFIVWKVLFRKNIKFSKQDIIIFRKRWKMIESMDNQSAVMEADKFLHFYLKKLGYVESMGETLKNHPALFKNIDGLWDAHKQRNRIAHEIGFTLSNKDRSRVMNIFYNSCKDLGL